MAATVKAAAFAAFLRVWLEAFPCEFASVASRRRRWLAIATMIVGNAIGLAAAEPQATARLLEHRARRLSSSSPSRRARTQGASAMLFYLFAYTLATFGAFAVDRRADRAASSDRDHRRLRRPLDRAPWLAVAMAVFMLALLGFPIFGGIGFFAKWYVLKAALQAPTPQTTLAVVLVLTTVISAGYYLYVVHGDVHAAARRRRAGARADARAGRASSCSRCALRDPASSASLPTTRCAYAVGRRAAHRARPTDGTRRPSAD